MQAHTRGRMRAEHWYWNKEHSTWVDDTKAWQKEIKTMFAEVVELVALNKQGDVTQFLADQGAAFELVVTSAGKGCANALMEQLPNLKVIFNWGVGYDKVDVEFATSRNVQVTNTPDVLNECVADMAIGMLISQAR